MNGAHALEVSATKQASRMAQIVDHMHHPDAHTRPVKPKRRYGIERPSQPNKCTMNRSDNHDGLLVPFVSRCSMKQSEKQDECERHDEIEKGDDSENEDMRANDSINEGMVEESE